MVQTTCRACGKRLYRVFSFGSMPLANVFTGRAQTYPLILSQCTACGLFQLGYIVEPEKIFPRYGYVSGAAAPVVTHLRNLAQECIGRFALTKSSKILDVGANDGTLLAAFGDAVGLRVGVDPARLINRTARTSSIHMLHAFFGRRTAQHIVNTFGKFQLILITHTLANVVDFTDFFEGIKRVLAPDGTVVIEVGSASTVVAKGYFDAIYHEHYAYFSPETLTTLLSLQGFTVSETRNLSVQGGSFRIYASRASPHPLFHPVSRSEKTHVQKIMSEHVQRFRTDIQKALRPFKGKIVIGFGAPAKSVTLVHAAGIAPCMASFIDSTTGKQGHVFPGTNIPICPESHLSENEVAAIIVFSWNYQKFILQKIRKLATGHPTIIIPFPKFRTFVI